MSCERFHEALSRHAAGGALMGEAAAHLRGCAGCSARLEQQRRLLAEVDAELERTLAIEASPELIDRVIARSRVAGETRWSFRFAWAGLAAATAALVMAFYLRAPVDGPSTAAPAAGVRQSSASPASSNAANLQQSVTPKSDPKPAAAKSVRGSAASRSSERRQTAPDGSRPIHAQRTAAKTPAEPEVLVQPDQARAIARLYQLLREGRLTEEMLPAVRSHEAAELSVAPLRIPDITVPDVDSVGHTDAVSRERQ